MTSSLISIHCFTVLIHYALFLTGDRYKTCALSGTVFISRSGSTFFSAQDLDGKQDIQSKVMVTMFGLFAEIERDLISERTCEGLAAARAKGRVLGRPKGSHGRSRLDGKEDEIKMLLAKKVSKASIAKILDVSRSALLYFISSRELC